MGEDKSNITVRLFDETTERQRHDRSHDLSCILLQNDKAEEVCISELSLMEGDSISTKVRHDSETKPATEYLGNEGPIFPWNLATLTVDRVWGAGERSGWET